VIVFKGKYTDATVMIDELDDSCAKQIVQFINHQAFTNPVVIMPDTHAGAGSVIGFTMELPNKVVPNTIGVDINCGMLSIQFSGAVSKGDIINNRKLLDKYIRQQIPFGMEVRDNPYYNMENDFPWVQANKLNTQFATAYSKWFDTQMNITQYDYGWFTNKCKNIQMDVSRAVNSLGTLGGGNHFIEISCSKNDDSIWATIHTGSRQFGKQICQYWQKQPHRNQYEQNKIAFSEGIKQIREQYRGKEIENEIAKLRKELDIGNKKPSMLEYLVDKDAHGYLTDMIFASIYAKENRHIIGDIITNIFHELFGVTHVKSIETVHNYINFDDFIIRKGAVSAHKDELFILPFNMEDGILICRGKGNPEWNFSAPHGAGRIYSRSKAKEKCSADIALERMTKKGIYTSAVPVDEVKEAYKDPQIIKEAISPTADIMDTLVPLINLKSA